MGTPQDDHACVVFEYGRVNPDTAERVSRVP
jgi:hypothetical protein